MATVLDPEVRRFLDTKLDLLRQVFRPQELFLFGSRVRGEAGEWSDIDLILVSEEFRGVPFPERAPWFYHAIRPHRHIDVLCYTPEEFEEKKQGINIVSEVLPEAIRIE